MPGAGDIRAGRAFVELYSDSSKLMADMRGIEAKFKALGMMIANWGKALSVAGGAVITPLVTFSKLAGSLGDELTGMSQRTGITVEALSALEYAASQSNTTLEGLETGIRNMQKFMVSAADGTSESVQAFARLGITLADLQGLSPDKQFEAIAAAMGKITNPSERAALAMKIFGKSGTELLPLLSGGAKGILAMMDRARELGVVISTKDAAAAAAFNNKLAEMWFVLKRIGFNIGVDLIPMLTTAANKIEEVAATTMKWLKANKEMIVYTFLIGTALATAGAALFVFGKIIVIAMTVMLGLSSALSAVWGLITAIGGAIATIFTSPWLAAIAAIAAAGAALIWLSGVGGKAVAWLGERFGELAVFVKDAFQGIADALLAGDIQLAAQILWKSLEVTFKQGKLSILEVWTDLHAKMVALLGTVENAVADTWDSIIKGVVNKFIDGMKIINHYLNLYDKFRTELIGTTITMHGVTVSGAPFANALPKLPATINDEAFNKKMQGIQDQNSADAAAASAARQKSLQDQINSILQGNGSSVADKLELRRMQEELGYLLRQAHTARGISESGFPMPSPPEFADMLAQAQKATFGTFSGRAASIAGAVGGGSIMETAAKKTAKNTEDTVKAVSDLTTAVNNSRPRFT